MSVIHDIYSIKNSITSIIKQLFKDWSIAKVINFSNLLKLIFLYIASIIIVLIIALQTSKDFFSKAYHGNLSDIRVAIYGIDNRIGERVLCQRMMHTLQKEGYDYVSMLFSGTLMDFWLTRHFYSVASSLLNYVFDIKYNISTTHYVKIIPYGYNITYLNVPRHMLFDVPVQFKSMFAHLQKYDAYIDLYSLVNGSNDLLEQVTTKKQKIIPLYFAHEDMEYEEVEINQALITGSLWGCNRSSLNLKLALERLAKDDILVAYGLLYDFSFLKTHYKKAIDKLPGSVVSNIDKLHKKYGIALVLHSYEHLVDGIPTSRISEAISTGALVISDRNRFVERFFGDNVLYIDSISEHTDAAKLSQQIKDHILWAKSHPQDVHNMTKNAHQIFSDTFSMEVQFKKLFEALGT